MREFWVSTCYLECNNPGGCSQKRFLLIALTCAGGVLLTLPTRGISSTLTQDLMPGKMVIACLGRGILIMIYRAFYGGHWNSSSGPDLLFYAFGSFSSIGNKYAVRGVVSHTCCVPLPTAPYQALIFLQLRFKENL